MKNIWVVFKREIQAYFLTPLAYVFIFIFLILSMILCFVMGGLLENEDASLTFSFFQFHPWLFMILGPAIGMRLWSEENREGTIELLLTMPISAWQAIIGKYLAACVVLIAALAMTFPVIITLNILGDPDMGKIWSGYLGSFLIGAASVAITTLVSAFTRSQVICLVVSVVINFILVIIGFGPVLEFLRNIPAGGFLEGLRLLALQIADGFSYLTHGMRIFGGLLRLDSIVFFLSVIGFCLYATSVVIRSKRA